MSSTRPTGNTDGARKVAVALEYQPEHTGAPKVLAAGFGEIARRILDIARQEHIHIHENETLARLLARVPPGGEIPETAYQLVAELLAFLYATDARLAEKMARARRQKLPAGRKPSRSTPEKTP